MNLANTIKQRALELGFDLVGIAPPSAARDLGFLPWWLKKGFGGEMRYLADPRREDPRRVLPSVESIICVALTYNTSYLYSTEVAAKSGTAWISRYAWGRDYHKVLRSKLEGLRTAVEKLASGAETRVYVDTGPLLERAFARLSGIGWMGKNTCLINEQKGSWFFLGVILTNLKMTPDLPAPDRCGSCTRCLDACPTGALVGPYVMDASRCISYFNIELKAAIPENFRAAMGENLFGCDICQDVCPWNSRPQSAASGLLSDDDPPHEHSVAKCLGTKAVTTHLPEFHPLEIEIKSHERVAEHPNEDKPIPQPPATESFSLFNPPLKSLASLTEEDFRKFFAHSPIRRVKYRGWLRNLCVVIGNSGDRRFIAWLKEVEKSPDPMVREHALWALRQLQAAESTKPNES